MRTEKTKTPRTGLAAFGALILIFCMLLTGCTQIKDFFKKTISGNTPEPVVTASPVTEAPATEVPATDEPAVTEVQVTESPTSRPISDGPFAGAVLPGGVRLNYFAIPQKILDLMTDGDIEMYKRVVTAYFAGETSAEIPEGKGDYPNLWRLVDMYFLQELISVLAEILESDAPYYGMHPVLGSLYPVFPAVFCGEFDYGIMKHLAVSHERISYDRALSSGRALFLLSKIFPEYKKCYKKQDCSPKKYYSASDHDPFHEYTSLISYSDILILQYFAQEHLHRLGKPGTVNDKTSAFLVSYLPVEMLRSLIHLS